ncbi:HAMP domain-containing histidine kinase [Streptomyces sp. AJS327]|nr:HAMP domain-containing histidine kinase [Streptomyces sp. AJS327]
MPLRSRLALLAALTVALAVAASATVCWFLVRAQLLSSLDNALLSSSDVDPRFVVEQVGTGECSTSEVRAPNPFGASVQVVDAHGKSCVIVGSALSVDDADVSVAEGELSEAVHDAPSPDGADYRVLTVPVRGTELAVTVARPLSEVDEPLNRLALVLAVVGGAGVLGAAGAGVAVARAGLRPVDRLAEVAGHIARTEDLAVRIPAEGDDEIARLSRSFNSMTASLAASRELQQQLIADAGHELRTPLTSLRTNIDLLVRSERTGRPLPEADRRALLESVTAQMTELGALIQDVQLLSRPETAPGGTARHRVVELGGIVGRAVERVRLRAAGVTVSVRGELGSWYMRADASAVERAVLNVLDNAVKFGGPAATVEVSLDGGELRVRDEGPGIAEDELPYVYERFWRSPAARALPGSGLGLAIVERVVRQTGGEVALRPAPDGAGGTVAVLRFPGSSAAPPPDGGPSRDDGPSPAPDDRPPLRRGQLTAYDALLPSALSSALPSAPRRRREDGAPDGPSPAVPSGQRADASGDGPSGEGADGRGREAGGEGT